MNFIRAKMGTVKSGQSFGVSRGSLLSPESHLFLFPVQFKTGISCIFHGTKIFFSTQEPFLGMSIEMRKTCWLT